MSPTDGVLWGCIIVAAGRGERFGGGIPKQFLPLGGRTVLGWSLETTLSLDRIRKTCLVLPPGCSGTRTPLHSSVVCAEGGARRRDSVENGLHALPGCTHILVHDAARPMASADLFERVMDACEEGGAAIPAVPVTDTLKRVADGCVSETVDRTGIWRSQTPQGFERGMLERILASPGDFTDESQAAEAAGFTVRCVEGEETNIKLTTPVDLELLSSLAGAPETRSGFGLDFHPFVADRPLFLCGCKLSETGGLLGHSDGDAALHAVMDAMLSAARLGDIGTLFPPSDPSLAGADSSVLLEGVLKQVTGSGWTVRSLDLTLVGERPRISPLRQVMRERLSILLCVPVDAVWVKGTTANSLGALGRGEGLCALATVELTRKRS